MATIPYLLFVAVPIIAALALDTDTFVPFFILFCVVAALCTSPAGSSETVFDKDADDQTRSGVPTRKPAMH